MILHFYKYQGTGNDFIIIDNRQNQFPKNNTKLVKNLCDRRFGIGGDGLILLENDKTTDFAMIYYNSDGNTSTMCGNGGRCIVAFAKKLNIITDKTVFSAIDGHHYATIEQNNTVALQMIDVSNIVEGNNYLFLNTGSPHHIVWVSNIETVDVKKEGAKIRYSDLYGKEGANVNFIAQKNDTTFSIRTYERGVEDETFSCGTGVTAAAIALHHSNKIEKNTVTIETLGGVLQVNFSKENGNYQDVFLIGPATFVFEGDINIENFS